MQKFLNGGKNNENEDEALEEHKFIASCLKIGLRIEDLKEMTYKDVAKIMMRYILYFAALYLMPFAFNAFLSSFVSLAFFTFAVNSSLLSLTRLIILTIVL